jgi:hypothetical protein
MLFVTWGVYGVAMAISYYLLFRLLGCISLFSGGIIRLIFRIVATYLALSAVYSFAVNNLLVYLGIAVAANLIFAFTRGREYLKDKKIAKNSEHLMLDSVYDELSDKMQRDCKEELNKAVSVYRQYYRTDDEWYMSFSRWVSAVNEKELAFLEKAKAQADTAQSL